MRLRASVVALALAACGTGPAAIDCDTLGLDGPSARGELGGVWDATRERLVVFGGNEAVPVDCAPGANAVLGDTWAFHPTCGAWRKLEAEGPRARSRYAVGDDAAHGRLVLNGGRFRAGSSGDYTLFRDTWLLDLATDTWTEVGDTGPGKRANHAGAVVGDAFVIFGGNASPDGAVFEPLDDVWSLDLEALAWKRVKAPGGPSPRLFHAAASDGTYLYVYGGGGADALFGSFFPDLWRLDPAEGTWTLLHDGSGTAPLGRINAHLLAEPGRLLLFGGHDDGALGNTNDVWSFDLDRERWKQLVAGDTFENPATGTCEFPADFAAVDPESPERREAAAVTWMDDRVIVFGGKSDCGNLDDVWTFDPAARAWDDLLDATVGEVCLRKKESCSSLCF